MARPEILKTLSGEKVYSVDVWENFRRGEIKDLFETYVYGRRPVERPDGLSFEITEEIENYSGLNAVMRRIKVNATADYSFDVIGIYPVSEKAVPAFVYIMHEYQFERLKLEDKFESPNIPLEYLIQKGYAIFIMPTIGVYPDFFHKSDYRDGVFRAFSPDREKRAPHDWATVSAWAWGASRVMDYIETDERINAKKVAVIGHSRGGKTALWCGATDTRFSFVISNSSGCGGAAVLRGKTGEHIGDINITDWFCGNYRRYAGCEELLPVDQHMLLALMAPRLLYVQSSANDDWADPASERLACRLANDAYALYGKTGAIIPEDAQVDTPYHDGRIGYHMRVGEHGINAEDWKHFIAFWERRHY